MWENEGIKERERQAEAKREEATTGGGLGVVVIFWDIIKLQARLKLKLGYRVMPNCMWAYSNTDTCLIQQRTCLILILGHL